MATVLPPLADWVCPPINKHDNKLPYNAPFKNYETYLEFRLDSRLRARKTKRQRQRDRKREKNLSEGKEDKLSGLKMN